MAKLSSTGSCISMTTASSSLSTVVLCFKMMFPVPRSPDEENLIPSFVTLIEQVSPNTPRSRMMRWNSVEGRRTLHLYSVSGMPRCSESISMSLSSNSEIRSWLGDSKCRARLSVPSSDFNVTTSSFPAHFKIFPRLGVLTPRDTDLSQLKICTAD